MKSGEAYNIVVVPKKSSTIRRFQFSKRSFWCAGALLSTAFVLFIGAVMAAWTYWTAYQKVEKIRQEASLFQRERASLISKIQQLDASVSRVSRLAAELQEKQALKTERSGKGPIEKENIFDSHLRWRRPLDVSSRRNVNELAEELAENIHSVEENLNNAFLYREDQLYLWSSLPALWPARGWISSEFGDSRRFHGTHRWHQGVDIASPHGAPILASGDGEVISVGYQSGYGKMVIIDHGYGITSVYGHCSEVFVKEGTVAA